MRTYNSTASIRTGCDPLLRLVVYNVTLAIPQSKNTHSEGPWFQRYELMPHGLANADESWRFNRDFLRWSDVAMTWIVRVRGIGAAEERTPHYDRQVIIVVGVASNNGPNIWKVH